MFAIGFSIENAPWQNAPMTFATQAEADDYAARLNAILDRAKIAHVVRVVRA